MSNTRIKAPRFKATYYKSGWAYCEITAMPDDLIRMGLAVANPATRTGISPAGTPLANGFIVLRDRSDAFMKRDAHFRSAIDRVVSGAPCADFSMPPALRSRRPKKSQRARASFESEVLQLPHEEIEARIEAMPTLGDKVWVIHLGYEALRGRKPPTHRRFLGELTAMSWEEHLEMRRRGLAEYLRRKGDGAGAAA